MLSFVSALLELEIGNIVDGKIDIVEHDVAAAACIGGILGFRGRYFHSSSNDPYRECHPLMDCVDRLVCNQVSDKTNIIFLYSGILKTIYIWVY